MGTNAAVYLGHAFARKDGVLARTYGKLCFRLPTSIKRFLRKPPDTRGYVRMEIGWALQVLGPEASAAAPSIIIVLASRDQFAVRHALRTLRGLEFDRHELDPLLED